MYINHIFLSTKWKVLIEGFFPFYFPSEEEGFCVHIFSFSSVLKTKTFYDERHSFVFFSVILCRTGLGRSAASGGNVAPAAPFLPLCARARARAQRGTGAAGGRQRERERGPGFLQRRKARTPKYRTPILDSEVITSRSSKNCVVFFPDQLHFGSLRSYRIRAIHYIRNPNISSGPRLQGQT